MLKCDHIDVIIFDNSELCLACVLIAKAVDVIMNYAEDRDDGILYTSSLNLSSIGSLSLLGQTKLETQTDTHTD